MSTLDARKVAERLTTHYYHENAWFSCPLSSDDRDKDSQCNCGYEERVKEIEKELWKAYEIGYETAYSAWR